MTFLWSFQRCPSLISKISDFAQEKESENVIVKYSNNLVAFEFEINDMKILATSLLIQWNFPDYEKEEIMPTSFNTKLIINKDDCEKAIKKYEFWPET